MLADLPPTPGPSSASPLVDPVQPPPIPRHSPRKSPRKSPHKAKAAGIAVGKAGSSKKIRIPRRSSGFGLSPRKVTPSYETEVIPSPSMQIPAFKTSIALSQPQPPVLAPVFVLPPPSPAASLQQGTRLSSSLIPPLPQAFNIPQTQSAPSITLSASDGAVDAPQPESTMSITASKSAPEVASASLSVPVPSTPVVRRPFPMAKPLAAVHMRHAYSPAKPSPLSRILMLSNSPDSPDIDRPHLDALREDVEDELDISPTPAPPAPAALAPAKSLAAELGISDDEDESPLREKKIEPNLAKAKAGKPGMKTTAKEKGKGRADPAPMSRTRAAVPLEKENVKRAKLSAGAPTRGTTTQTAVDRKVLKAPPKPFSKSTVAAKLPANRGGARRVPIDSAEAAPVSRGGPGWKG